ncbi:PorT family protein [Cecembia rubra]|uniref:PorT family protein n=1 Tax=Cecembia rubra TaxID=1485585 RepID=UPI002714BA45|nr:PorT family protein [Cecembia rubra]
MPLSFAQQAEFGISSGPARHLIIRGERDCCEFRFGFYRGDYIELALFNKIALEPIIQFARIGTKKSEFGTAIGLRNDYLNFRLLLNMQTNETIYALVCPHTSFLLNFSFVMFEPDNKATNYGNELKDLRNRSDFFAVLCLGV